MKHTMKHISQFEDCLHYVSRLGFAGVGNIPMKQTNLCQVCHDLLTASGQTTWYHESFRPFYVRYSRKQRAFTVRVDNAFQTIVSI